MTNSKPGILLDPLASICAYGGCMGNKLCLHAVSKNINYSNMRVTLCMTFTNLNVMTSNTCLTILLDILMIYLT